MIKILAESLEEFRLTKYEETINEGAKGLLIKFLKDPTGPKASDRFKLAFKNQWKKYPQVGVLIDTLDIETKQKLATSALAKIKENPSMDRVQIPWQKKEDGKIILNTTGDISGTGLQGRSGIHGGTK